ncbi:flagellar protein FlgN [Methylobacterium oryzisoli]|uniref:flagellar protein FlgN n=1 Tax=Methylobacterium oryzisoli TaxID=3385502 RepID=UPI003892317F
MLLASLTRLEATIDAETDALSAQAAIDQEAFNRRKSQSLLELTRLARRDDALADPAVAACLMRLRDKLARNQEVVALHLRAAEEVSEVITGALRAAESDGTYTAAPRAAR